MNIKGCSRVSWKEKGLETKGRDLGKKNKETNRNYSATGQ